MKLIRSFGYAFRGIFFGTRGRNMRIHLAFTALVVIFGFYFSVSLLEWVILLFCIGAVLSAELFNTAIEKIGDIVVSLNKEAYDPMGAPKDVAAGAVLVLAIIAAIIGSLVFLPHALKLFFV